MSKRSFETMKSPAARSRPCLSLKDLCIHKALDNLDMLGDVGGLDSQFLKVLLPHCTAEQLWTIEEATKGRDLTKITNDLWMKCYSRKFGQDSVNVLLSAMAKRGKTFKWKTLYQRKLKEEEQVAEQCVKSLTAKYKAAEAQKASRQVTQIDKPPPSSKKRGVNVPPSRTNAAALPGVKGRLIRKARQELSQFDKARRPARPFSNNGYQEYLKIEREKEEARQRAIANGKTQGLRYVRAEGSSSKFVPVE